MFFKSHMTYSNGRENILEFKLPIKNDVNDVLNILFLGSMTERQRSLKQHENMCIHQFSTKNGKPFMRFDSSFTRQQHFGEQKTETFENGSQSAGF